MGTDWRPALWAGILLVSLLTARAGISEDKRLDTSVATLTDGEAEMLPGIKIADADKQGKSSRST